MHSWLIRSALLNIGAFPNVSSFQLTIRAATRSSCELLSSIGISFEGDYFGIFSKYLQPFTKMFDRNYVEFTYQSLAVNLAAFVSLAKIYVQVY